MNSDQPWQQLDDEPDLWFERFEMFRELGPQRTVASVFRRVKDTKGLKRTATGVPGAWRAAIDKFRWWDRARAWDMHQRQLRRQRWQQEHDLIIEEAIAIARQEMLAKAREMSRFPLAVRSIDTDTGSVVVMPARWCFRDMVTLTKAAVDLVQQATGHSEVDELRFVEMGIEFGFFPESVLEVATGKLENFKESVKRAIMEGTTGGSHTLNGESFHRSTENLS